MSLPPSYNLLSKVKGHNRVYVESGTYRGDSIDKAVEAGYEKIIGIEIDPVQVDFCKHRFDLHNNPCEHLQIIEGDSALILGEVLATINEPAVILLDAHSQWLEGEKEFPHPWPLFLELQQITRYVIKTGYIPTLLIDDILHLTHPDITGDSLKDIFNWVRSIYMSYRIDLIANPVKNNFMICKP